MNLFQRALQQEVLNVPPIWFMRQAGRYHSHYQGLRAKNSFMQLCQNPELACEVALGPVNDFDFDAAILFSDILFPLDAVGFGLSFTDAGPRFDKKLSGDFQKAFFAGQLPVEEIYEKLKFQAQALRLTRAALPKSKGLIGFMGGLWTLFTYAVDADHKPPLLDSKKALHLFPQFVEKMLPLINRCIQGQLEAGADVVCLFDTSAGELTPFHFQQLVMPVLKTITDKFPRKIIYYSKGTTQDHFRTPDWSELQLLGQGYDHRFDLKNLLVGSRSGALQGNFDQALLFSEPQDLKTHIESYLAPLKRLSPEQRRGWISGLGHGILPKTPEQSVRIFIEQVRKELG